MTSLGNKAVIGKGAAKFCQMKNRRSEKY